MVNDTIAVQASPVTRKRKRAIGHNNAKDGDRFGFPLSKVDFSGIPQLLDEYGDALDTGDGLAVWLGVPIFGHAETWPIPGSRTLIDQLKEHDRILEVKTKQIVYYDLAKFKENLKKLYKHTWEILEKLKQSDPEVCHLIDHGWKSPEDIDEIELDGNPNDTSEDIWRTLEQNNAKKDQTSPQAAPRSKRVKKTLTASNGPRSSVTFYSAAVSEPVVTTDCARATRSSQIFDPESTPLSRVNRGDIVDPPCDLCRKESIQCVKKQGTCQNCSKKHIACRWYGVTESDLEQVAESSLPQINGSAYR